jgi:hypothetical protein
MALTCEDIRKVLGDVDDTFVAAVIGMGATAEELAEAQAWLISDEPLVNTGKPMPSGRISKLAELLATVEEEKSLAGRGDEP